MNKTELNERIELKIKQFKEEFLLEFETDVFVVVKSTRNGLSKLTLLELGTTINSLLVKEFPEYPDGIRTRTRRHDVVNFRYCFYRIARSMGHSFIGIGRYLGFSHATVMNGDKVIWELLQTDDKQSVFNMNNIYHELKERFGINADIQFDKSAENKL